TKINFADLRVSGAVADHLFSSFGRSRVRRNNVNDTVIIDVDLHASLSRDLLNHFTTRANQVSDLVWLNGNLEDTWRMLTQLCWCADGVIHMLQDMLPAGFRLSQRFCQNLSREA